MNDRNNNGRQDTPYGRGGADETNDIQWTKDELNSGENTDRKRTSFDLDDLLNYGSLDLGNLEEKITDVLDGKDILDREAYGEFPPDYMGRRGEGVHGRHMAPTPEGEEEEPEESEAEPEPEWVPVNDEAEAIEEEEEESPLPPNFDEQVPPRPKVVVEEPVHTVYVKPDSEYGNYDGYAEYERRPSRSRLGMRGWQKSLIALVIAAVVIIVGYKLVANFMGGIFGGSASEDEQADTASEGILSGILTSATSTPSAAAATPTPTKAASATTPVSVTTYSITVTAGTGGTISPSGIVSVEEGESVKFVITPNNGYEISQLLIDGTSVTPSTSYTFSDVTSNHTIYAVFTAAAAATTVPTAEPTAAPTPEPTPEVTDNSPPDAMETNNIDNNIGGNEGPDNNVQEQNNNGDNGLSPGGDGNIG